MNINEEKKIRERIQEILMSLPEFQELMKKPNIKSIKKDAYNDIIDLKGKLEAEEIDAEDIISQIKKTIIDLNIFKNSINHSLKG